MLFRSATGVYVNSTYIGTLSANNSTYLNGQLASYYTNATNITTGTLPYAQIPANIVNTTAAFTISGVYTHTANLVVNTGIVAGGSRGTAGQVLTSNGSSGNVYWSTVAGGGFNPYYGISTTSIRIGCGAGTSSSPYQGIAIGYCAGHHCQGCDTVALGPFAGASYQGNYSVAIGQGSGQCSQSSRNIAIGLYAGNIYQGNGNYDGYAVAIGSCAGYCHQGQYSIAIGTGEIGRAHV